MTEFTGHTLDFGKYARPTAPGERAVYIRHTRDVMTGEGITSLILRFDDASEPQSVLLEKSAYGVMAAMDRWLGILNTASVLVENDGLSMTLKQNAAAVRKIETTGKTPEAVAGARANFLNEVADHFQKQKPVRFTRPLPRPGVSLAA